MKGMGYTKLRLEFGGLKGGWVVSALLMCLKGENVIHFLDLLGHQLCCMPLGGAK
jgi:hypothetical protein